MLASPVHPWGVSRPEGKSCSLGQEGISEVTTPSMSEARSPSTTQKRQRT